MAAVLLVGQATGGGAAVATAIHRAEVVVGTPAGALPIVAADQEGGRVQHLCGKGFERIPSAEDQGTMTPTVLRQHARTRGEELRAVGVNLDLVPVADVVTTSTGTGNTIGALQRAYGSDPTAVSEHVAAFVTGINQAEVAAAVKHFPGLGKVRGNTDFSSWVVDPVTTRDDPDLAPFGAGTAAGAQFLMVSLATYSEIDAHHRAVFSPTVIGAMVRHDLGFHGVVISDDLGAAKEVSAVPAAQRRRLPRGRWRHDGRDYSVGADRHDWCGDRPGEGGPRVPVHR